MLFDEQDNATAAWDLASAREELQDTAQHLRTASLQLAEARTEGAAAAAARHHAQDRLDSALLDAWTVTLFPKPYTLNTIP